MLTDDLIAEMGLLKLQSKHAIPPQSEASFKSAPNAQLSESEAEIKADSGNKAQVPAVKSTESVKLDKSEFRLLVKMLHAIGHKCTYDHISYDGQIVTYQHPKKNLVFNDITLTDTNQVMNLSSLSDLLVNDQLKRPVWEKLKTL